VSLTALSIDRFCEELSSSSPAPGGGSVAALSGALAAALCAMVCRITLAREQRKESWPEMRAALDVSESRGSRLRALVTEDAQAFQAVFDARRLPRGTAEQSEARQAALQNAGIHCAEVPLETLEELAALAPVVGTVFARGEPGCVTDAGTAAAAMRAAALAADYNVRINLPGIRAQSVRRGLADRADKARAAVLAAAADIEARIERRLREGSVE
jgi:formiminotetrahydrofolate cyclodeaminase